MEEVDLDSLTHGTVGQAHGIIADYELDWRNLLIDNGHDNDDNGPDEDPLLKYPFPEEVWGFRQLQTFWISNCPHQKLPDQICNLVSLQRLTLSHCQFTELPANIGSLSCLEHLIIQCCDQLKSIPKEINYLDNLKSLVLWSNTDLESFQQFFPTYIPDEDEGSRLEHRMSSLKILELTSLPQLQMSHSFFDSMPFIETLIVYGCDRVRSFPASLANLKNLRTLDINSCRRLRVLPTEIGQLVTLEDLVIRCCERLRQLPSSVKKIVNLKNATIGGPTNLDDLSPLVDHLPQVQNKLRIGNFNNLTSIQTSIAHFSRLKELDIFDLAQEESFSLPYLPHLKRLTMRFISKKEIVKNLFQDPGWKTTTDNANKSHLATLSLLHCNLLASDYAQMLRDLPESVTVLTIESPFAISFLGTVPDSLLRNIRKLILGWDRSFRAEVRAMDAPYADEQNLVYAQQVMEANPKLAFIFPSSSAAYSPYLAYLVCFNLCGRALLGGNDNIVVGGSGGSEGDSSDLSTKVPSATTPTSSSTSTSTTTMTNGLPPSMWPEVLANVKDEVNYVKSKVVLPTATEELEASILYRLLHSPAFLSRTFKDDNNNSISPDSNHGNQDEAVASSVGQKRKATTTMIQESISRKK